MRIRDIRQTGFYARAAGGGGAEQPAAGDNHTRQFHALHVVGIAPVFLAELVQFVFIPITATTNGNAGLIPPDILFGEDDGWHLLCDGTESGFGPHTFLMKLMELAGYSEDEARRIARDTLIESLDRQIYGSAQTGHTPNEGHQPETTHRHEPACTPPPRPRRRHRGNGR